MDTDERKYNPYELKKETGQSADEVDVQFQAAREEVFKRRQNKLLVFMVGCASLYIGGIVYDALTTTSFGSATGIGVLAFLGSAIFGALYDITVRDEDKRLKESKASNPDGEGDERVYKLAKRKIISPEVPLAFKVGEKAVCKECANSRLNILEYKQPNKWAGIGTDGEVVCETKEVTRGYCLGVTRKPIIKDHRTGKIEGYNKGPVEGEIGEASDPHPDYETMKIINNNGDCLRFKRPTLVQKFLRHFDRAYH